MANETVYDWKSSRRLDDWKLEGFGELLKDPDGAFHVRTFNHGPLRRATNAWLRDVELPDDFEVEWTYRNGSETNAVVRSEGAMILFNARPLALKDIFEDPRPYALYSDICSYNKMVCYSCGFYRSPYGTPSQLRKLGGRVPASWGESNWVSEDGRAFDDLTIVGKADEPLTAASIGEYARYRLSHAGDRINLWCNDRLVHDFTDRGQYPYCPEPLRGGRLAFRNFNGYVDSYYPEIVVRKL